MIHQVIEQCLIALIRVHLAYRSEIHNLGRMLGLCTAFSDRPLKKFLSGSAEDKRLFEVLTKSYTGARYAPTFKVNEEEAIYQKVSAFKVMTLEMCQEKIEYLDKEATNYKELRFALRTQDHSEQVLI